MLQLVWFFFFKTFVENKCEGNSKSIKPAISDYLKKKLYFFLNKYVVWGPYSDLDKFKQTPKQPLVRLGQKY